VELNAYNGIPHLLTPVVVDPERVIGALQWMMREMDSRYQKFTRTKVRNIQEYNQKQQDEYIPHIVIVIDELADLMMLAREETERCITRLAQLARATGIHLIIATQRPSVDVITGLIKANFPARIAFAVASGIDSRVILDQPGAERLLGRGDMLFQPPDAPSPLRLQGPYVSDSEIQLLVDYWRYNALPPDQATPSSITTSRIDSLPQGVPLQQIPLWKEEPRRSIWQGGRAGHRSPCCSAACESVTPGLPA
jgi:S-DNA-T family DNA segregation ATPase FtsK/SpoIIIE